MAKALAKDWLLVRLWVWLKLRRRLRLEGSCVGLGTGLRLGWGEFSQVDPPKLMQ